MSTAHSQRPEYYNAVKEEGAIQEKLKKLPSRVLYVVIHKIFGNSSKPFFVDDLGYLRRRLVELKITSEVLDRYIDMSYDNVLNDKIVGWIFKNLRVALWFDYYLEKSHSHLDSHYITIFQQFIHTSYIEDCIKKFDTCRLLTKEENSIENNSLIDSPNQSSIISTREFTDLMWEGKIDELSKRIDNENRSKGNYHINSHRTMSEERRQLERKTEYISSAKIVYSNCKTLNKYLEWLDEKNEEQLMWAQEYLLSQGLLLQPNSFLIDDLNDVYNQICASFDVIDTLLDYNSTTYETSGMSLRKKEIIRKMRGAWSQKKFRDKKDAESAQEYFLTRPYMNKLKKLANNDKISSAEYLQKLIDDAFNRME